MTNQQLLDLVKCLARQVKLLEENISRIYDSLSKNQIINIYPVQGSYEDIIDAARLEELIYKY